MRIPRTYLFETEGILVLRVRKKLGVPWDLITLHGAPILVRRVSGFANATSFSTWYFGSIGCDFFLNANTSFLAAQNQKICPRERSKKMQGRWYNDGVCDFTAFSRWFFFVIGGYEMLEIVG